ncbi:hypothetical protein [Leptolyngbya sp. CCY15150]|uniref:hypothetical protein n=1 Tax=Leptolyngbya sp. CCY15150 TaxID=2767772 RepID=UPI00194E1617|nr:hypothetical protein [Leptolyngbya sp. CCY15150]
MLSSKLFAPAVSRIETAYYRRPNSDGGLCHQVLLASSLAVGLWGGKPDAMMVVKTAMPFAIAPSSPALPGLCG